MSAEIFAPQHGVIPAAGAPERFAAPAPFRILMTVDAVGGVWNYAMELARALRPLRVATMFVGLGPPPSREQVSQAQSLGDLQWLGLPLDWMVEDESALDPIPETLERLVEENEIDLLHLNLPSQAVGLAHNVPVVVISHSCVVTWWATMRGQGLPARWLWQERRNLEGFARADAIVAPSSAHADILTRCYGPLPGLKVVHNGFGAVFPDRPKEEFVFAAGRWWDEGKNISVLDSAAVRSTWPARIAGSLTGPSGETVFPRNLHALGPLPHSHVLDLAARAAIVASPSLYEPFGLAALEGARAGAALVVSDIPTYRELWREAALFFDPRDPRALGEALNMLAADPALRAEMGARSLARSRRYTPNRQATSMMEIYQALCPAHFRHLVPES